MEKVGIIGGAGFIGSYITKIFLENGYNVQASTRDLRNEKRYQHLQEFPNQDQLQIKELDVKNAAAIDDFIADCDIVIHGGTPFQLAVDDPKQELFDPTIKGTENFLKAVQKNDSVKKVVFIASVAALNTNFPFPPGNRQPGEQISEDDAPFMSEESHPYSQAKFIANQTVERFIDEHPDLDFEITTVSPVGVMGKPLSGREDSTSAGLQFLIKNEMAPNPFMETLFEQDTEFALVSVEDVAKAVFKAATADKLHGKNYLLSSESWRISDISRMLNHENPEAEPQTVYDSSRATQELGIEFKPAEVPLHQFSQ